MCNSQWIDWSRREAQDQAAGQKLLDWERERERNNNSIIFNTTPIMTSCQMFFCLILLISISISSVGLHLGNAQRILLHLLVHSIPFHSFPFFFTPCVSHVQLFYLIFFVCRFFIQVFVFSPWRRSQTELQYCSSDETSPIILKLQKASPPW